MLNRALPHRLRNAAAEPKATDTRSFDEFIREHYNVLLRFLRGRTASEQDAEDAAQESFARLSRYRETHLAESWKPLLFRIATNVAHDQSRRALSHHRKAHLSLDDSLFDTLAADMLSPERKLADERQLALVLQAIRRLSKKCRHVFLLSRFDGMSNKEIATHCGISVRMVEKQITKALAACRTTVRDYDS